MMVPFFKKHEKDKKVLGMLQPGDVVTVLEVKMDKKGNMKIRHEQGWTPQKSPDGRVVLEPVDGASPGALEQQTPSQQSPRQTPQQTPQPPAPAESESVDGPGSAGPAEQGVEDPETGEIRFKLFKGPQGFGINIDDRGVVIGFTGTNSPTEVAGVPVGTLLVRVNGEAVLGKAQVIGEIRAAGSVSVMAFGFMTPQAYMAKKQGGDDEIAADVPEADVAETVEEPPPPAGVQKPTCTAALVDETSLLVYR